MTDLTFDVKFTFTIPDSSWNHPGIASQIVDQLKSISISNFPIGGDQNNLFSFEITGVSLSNVGLNITAICASRATAGEDYTLTELKNAVWNQVKDELGIPNKLTIIPVETTALTFNGIV